MTIHSDVAAFQPLTTLLSFGLRWPIVADQQARGNPGMRGDQATHQRGDRIVALGEAENDVIARIIEREDGGERLLREKGRRRRAAVRSVTGGDRRARRHRLGAPRAAESGDAHAEDMHRSRHEAMPAPAND